jgi:hypothetical protein
MFTRAVDSSPHTIRPKRVFWVTSNGDAGYLDMALAKGQGIEFITPVPDGVFVITDGMVPVSQNDPDNPAVLRSGSSDGSEE